MTIKSPISYFAIIPTSVLRLINGFTCQLLQLKWNYLPEPVEIHTHSTAPDSRPAEPVRIEPGEFHRGDVLVGVPVPKPLEPGDTYKVRVEFHSNGAWLDEIHVDFTYPKDDWRLFIGAGYHVDPVWWNTQRDYTEVGSRQGKGVGTFLELNRKYIDLISADNNFACTIETVPALHPTWLMHPELRETIRSLINSGRLEIIGSYDEPQSTLVGCELLCRNISYGIGFTSLPGSRKPEGLAQWDVFGHDPVWPSLGKSAGLKWNTFCRGLYHGDHLGPEDNLFPSEFRWVSPDSNELLTHYMSRHYTSGWEFSWKSFDEAEIPVLERFEKLAVTASTRNVLLPCYGDFAEPFDGMLEFIRKWNEKYLSPKILIGTQNEYISAVKEACSRENTWLTPISRDLNPAFTGCNLSFIGTKQAQRSGESLLRNAEIWSSLAFLYGAKYPITALDRAWRIFCYTSHHDSVTGSESDQVYLDLNSLWREACDIGQKISSKALEAIADLVNTSDAASAPTVTVFNSHGWEHSGYVTLDPKTKSDLSGDIPNDKEFDLIDENGKRSPILKHGNFYTFKAAGVPPLGWKSYSLVLHESFTSPSPHENPNIIENDVFNVKLDPLRGGGIIEIIEKDSDRNFIRDAGVGNDIAVYPEYPGMNMGPWLIQPTGERFSISGYRASMTRSVNTGIQSITSTVEFHGCIVERTVTLRDGEPFLDCLTTVGGYSDRDHLWKVEFPVDVPGTLPAAQTSGGVIGRPFGRLGDYQTEKYFGDWAVDIWGGLESLLIFNLKGIGNGLFRTVAIGEIVIPDNPNKGVQSTVDRLVPLLARCGVTTVVTRAGSRRSGDWLMDGSRPDFRIALGPESSFYQGVLDEIPEISSKDIDTWLTSNEATVCWVDPGGEFVGYDLPLILFPEKDESIQYIFDRWESEIKKPRAGIDINGPCFVADCALDKYSPHPVDVGFAVIVRGTPGMQVLPDGTISLGLFRSSSGCPSGGWVDGDPVRVPDNSHFLHEHWSHRFEYRLMPHPGDWRNAGVYKRALEFNHPPDAVITKPFKGPPGKSGSFFNINRNDIFVQAIRPLQMPDISFDHSGPEIDPGSGLLVRLREIAGRQSDLQFPKENFRDVSRVNIIGENLPGKGDDCSSLSPWSIGSYSVSPHLNPDLPLDGLSLEKDIVPNYLLPSRYWRSSLGPCGWKAQPVFHQFKKRSIEISKNETVEVTLQVVSNVRNETGNISITLQAPAGISIDPDYVEIKNLGPEEVLDIRINLVGVGGSVHSEGFLNAILKMTDDVRTIASVPVNRTRDLPAPVRIEIPDSVIVTRGGTDLPLVVTNELGQEVEGILEIILPFEAWSMVSGEYVRQAVRLDPGSKCTIIFPLENSPEVVSGRYSGVFKWHSCEEQKYSKACWIVVPDGSGCWVSAEQGRLVYPSLPPGTTLSFSVYNTGKQKIEILNENNPDDDSLVINYEDKDITGGHVRTYRIEATDLLNQPEGEISTSFVIQTGTKTRRFSSVILIPQGPRIFSQWIEDELSLENTIEEKMLAPGSVKLNFRTSPDQPIDRSIEIPVWTGHNTDSLYFVTRIPWRMSVNPFNKREILRGDCLQLAFFPSRLAEVGFALNKDGPYSWSFYEIMDAPRPKSPPIYIDRRADYTIIRSMIPWRIIHLDQCPSILPWNMVIHKMGQYSRWEGAWVMSEGTLFRKTTDAREFGMLLMKE